MTSSNLLSIKSLLNPCPSISPRMNPYPKEYKAARKLHKNGFLQDAFVKYKAILDGDMYSKYYMLKTKYHFIQIVWAVNSQNLDHVKGYLPEIFECDDLKPEIKDHAKLMYACVQENNGNVDEALKYYSELDEKAKLNPRNHLYAISRKVSLILKKTPLFSTNTQPLDPKEILQVEKSLKLAFSLSEDVKETKNTIRFLKSNFLYFQCKIEDALETLDEIIADPQSQGLEVCQAKMNKIKINWKSLNTNKKKAIETGQLLLQLCNPEANAEFQQVKAEALLLKSFFAKELDVTFSSLLAAFYWGDPNLRLKCKAEMTRLQEKNPKNGIVPFYRLLILEIESNFLSKERIWPKVSSDQDLKMQDFIKVFIHQDYHLLHKLYSDVLIVLLKKPKTFKKNCESIINEFPLYQELLANTCLFFGIKFLDIDKFKSLHLFSMVPRDSKAYPWALNHMIKHKYEILLRASDSPLKALQGVEDELSQARSLKADLERQGQSPALKVIEDLFNWIYEVRKT